MTNLQTITEIDMNVNSENDLTELEEKMNYITNKIATDLHGLIHNVNCIKFILESNELNIDFEKQEYIEEYFDKFVYQYTKIKDYFKKGREIRCYKEKKEQEKMNELRYARNVLMQLGINNIEE